MNGEKEQTKGGRTKKVDLPTICRWIQEVWEERPSDIIVRAFLKISISNALDGSEDDAFWEDDIGEQINSDDGDSDDDLENADIVEF